MAKQTNAKKTAADKSFAGKKAKKPTSKEKAAPKKQRAGGQKTSKTLSARDKLAEELVHLIPELDAEGLLFLIRQANVLLHNKRVDELNAELETQNTRDRQEHKRAGTTARVGQNVEEITVEMQQSTDGKTFYMIIDGHKHFLTVEEMQAVVKLCFKPERKSDALRFLYEYMYNERGEILDDHHISGRKHPFFEALFYEVRHKFSLRD